MRADQTRSVSSRSRPSTPTSPASHSRSVDPPAARRVGSSTRVCVTPSAPRSAGRAGETAHSGVHSPRGRRPVRTAPSSSPARTARRATGAGSSGRTGWVAGPPSSSTTPSSSSGRSAAEPAVPPVPLEHAQCVAGRAELVAGEPAQLAPGGELLGAQLPAAEPQVLLAQQVRVVELGGQDRRQAQGQQVPPALAAQPVQDARARAGTTAPTPGAATPRPPARCRGEPATAGACAGPRTGSRRFRRWPGSPAYGDGDQVEAARGVAHHEVLRSDRRDGLPQRRRPLLRRGGQLVGDQVAGCAASRGPWWTPRTSSTSRCAAEQVGELRLVELAAVEDVAAAGTCAGSASSRAAAAGPQHPGAPGDEAVLVPEVLDGLRAHDDVRRPVAARQVRPGSHAPARRRVRARDVGQRRAVQVQTEDQVGAGLGQRRPPYPSPTPASTTTARHRSTAPAAHR